MVAVNTCLLFYPMLLQKTIMLKFNVKVQKQKIKEVSNGILITEYVLIWNIKMRSLKEKIELINLSLFFFLILAVN